MPHLGRGRAANTLVSSDRKFSQYFFRPWRLAVKSLATELAKSLFRSGFEEPKLRRGQAHFLTDLSLALFVQVETSENLAVAGREGAQNLHHQVGLFIKEHGLFGIIANIGQPSGVL